MQAFRNGSAVSAIIGVILMIAITLAIAATVYFYVSGFFGAAVKPPQCLDIQLNPPGYPELYDEWEITVWKIENGIRQNGDNVTITIEVFQKEPNNVFKTYNISTDSQGKCNFEYSDSMKHKFTATAKGFATAYFEPNKKYFTPNSIIHITALFSPLGLIAIISILFALYRFEQQNLKQSGKNKKKWKKFFLTIRYIRYISFITIMIVFIIGLVLTGNLYSSHTSFGYPDDGNLFYLTIFFGIFIVLVAIFIITLLFELKFFPRRRKM